MKEHEESFNMTIIRETPTQLTLACHCGHQFDCEITDKRPQCPHCECYWHDERWEAGRRLKNMEKRPLKYFMLLIYEKGDPPEERRKAIGIAFTMAEFMMRNLDTLDKLKENVRVQCIEITRDEFIDAQIDSETRMKDVLIGAISELIGVKNDKPRRRGRDRDRN